MKNRILGPLFVALLVMIPLAQSFSAPNTLTASPQIPRRPTHVRHASFGNGISALMTGNTVTFTLRNGNRLTVDHSNPTPGAQQSADRCENHKHWLDTHGDSAQWRKRCLNYFDFCLGDA